MRPDTRIDEVVEQLHGVEVRDPYRWLEDGDDPAVQAWTAAQNAYARSALDALPGRAAIAARIRESLDSGALGGSAPRARWRFFTRRPPGGDQPMLLVSEAGGEPRVLVDPGPMSTDGTVALDWWQPSRDGELVAFGLSEAGTEDATLRLLHTATGAWLGEEIPHCRWSVVAFEPGNAAFLYTRLPDPGAVPAGEEAYHRHIWRHVIGTSPAEDGRVFGEGRDKLDMPSVISISESGRWTAITISKGWSSTVTLLREGSGPFQPILEDGRAKAYAWFAGDRLLALTDLGAPNWRLVEIDPERPAPEAWRDVIPESEHVLVDVSVTADRLAAHHLVDVSSRVTLHHLDGRPDRVLDLPPLSTVSAVGGHPSSPRLYITVEGFTQPAATFTAEGQQVDRLEPPPRFDPERHPVRQVWFSSKDGTRVPMFLIGRAEGAGPTVLTGYGGFSVNRTPAWVPVAIPFLEAGGLVALANLRGGAEFGERWHEAGARERKQNVFDDFIAAAEWLIANGLAAPRQLGISGGSNGGLLVGAAMTQRPELFGAVVCSVPLLDMVRYEGFKVAQLWADEYGSASDPEQFGWLNAYSPYHHVQDGARYPATLITTGEEDSRVDPMHARKMTARLQAAAPSSTVLLRVEPRAGHGQGKPIAKVAPEQADIWSFLLHTLAE